MKRRMDISAGTFYILSFAHRKLRNVYVVLLMFIRRSQIKSRVQFASDKNRVSTRPNYMYVGPGSGPEVLKLFFVLNAAELVIFSANKYENANNSWHFHIY